MVKERRGREAGGGKKGKKVGAHPRARASEFTGLFFFFPLLFLDFLISLVGYFLIGSIILLVLSLFFSFFFPC